MTNLTRCLAALTLLPASAGAQPYLISTFAGGVPAPTAAVAINYALGSVNAVASDRFGNTYVSTSLNCVFRLDPNGMLERIAGTGQSGYSGDGGNALAAQLNNPQGVAIDSAGNLYIADQYNHRVRMVDLTGRITTVAGTGIPGYNGDSQPAANAELNYPQGIAVDAAGNLYIADLDNQRVREVTGGSIATIVGTGARGQSGDGGPATSATLNLPSALALDAAGNLYLADASYNVRKVIAGGTITHVAGNGTSGYSGDGGLAGSAALSGPAGLVVDPTGNLYIADEFNQRIRKVDLSGVITTFAGGNANVALGDGGPATAAHLNYPVGVSADSAGNIYIADQSNLRVRVVTPNGNIGTVAGSGGTFFSGDGGPASLAQFSGPRGIARDGNGNLYVADSSNNRVREINTSGMVSTIAGTGTCCSLSNGQSAVTAGINANSIAADAAGNVYIGDVAGVAQVSTSGAISFVAGTGTPGFGTLGGPAVNTALSGAIYGVAVDPSDQFYLSNTAFHQVLEVNSSGTINAVAGNGGAGYSGDGGLGPSEELNYPETLALGAGGANLYIADVQNNRVRLVNPGGIISTVAGNGNGVDSGDGGPASAASISSPSGVTVDGQNNLFITTGGQLVRMVGGSGNISTIAGTGSAGYSGDGGLATSAQLLNPAGLVIDAAGNIYFCDSGNNVVRVLQPAGAQPLLALSTVQQSPFTLGQAGASYNVTLSNAPLAGPTNGSILVTELVPAGFTLMGMSGNGWSCNANVCQRGDALQPGQSYDPIVVSVTIDPAAPPQVTNAVTASGGGSLGAVSSTATSLGRSVPVLQLAVTSSGIFRPGQSGTYTVTVGNQIRAATTTAPVTVTEAQLGAGLTLASINGMGWNCGADSCSRNEPLSGGSSYPPITVVASIDPSAPAQVSNQLTASGGGSSSATASVTTPVVPLACNLGGSAAPSVTGVQILINEALGITAASDDLNQDGAISIADVQIEINAVLTTNCVL